MYYHQYFYTCELCNGTKEIDEKIPVEDYPSLYKCSSCILKIQKTMVGHISEAVKNGMKVLQDTETKFWYVQEQEFKTYCRDWNCDGDVYSDTIAPFNIMVPNPKGVNRITISKNQIGKGNDYEIINLPIKDE